MIEFLLLNPLFPQSVRFCLNAAWEALTADRRPAPPAPGAGTSARPCGRSGCCRRGCEHTAVDEVLEEGLDVFLADVQRRIALVSEHVTAGYLRDEPQPGRLVARGARGDDHGRPAAATVSAHPIEKR